MDSTLANRVADNYAQDAHDNYFSSHRGIWHLEELDLLLLYNSHPYSLVSLRSEETKRIASRLAEAGISILAYGAAGPIVTSDERYTLSLLLDCGDERMREVQEIAESETEKSMEILDDWLASRTQDASR